jgi:hypothetical protein
LAIYAFSTLNSLPFFKITTSARVDIEDKTMTKTMAGIRYLVGIILHCHNYFDTPIFAASLGRIVGSQRAIFTKAHG